MPGRPPQRPRPVDALGSQTLGDDPRSTSRALDALTDALNRLRQGAATPTVNRLTLNDVTPVTNIPGSFYTDGADLFWLDFDGSRIQITANGAVNASGSSGSSIPYSSYWYSPIWTAGNALDTRGPTNDQCRALYMGRAPQDLSSIQVRWNQTAGGTMTYAEMGIATGTLNVGSTPSLVIRGYVDATVEWSSSGQRLKAIPVTGADIAAGTDIWCVYTASFSAGAPTIAVSNVSERLDVGGICTRAATRLSTNLNTAPLAFALDASATPAWLAFAL